MSAMASAVKRSVIGFCVAFGNMFLAHGLFFVLAYLFNDALDLLFYVLQLILNIVLYFTVLKKQFEPVKERKLLFYFLLAAIAGAVWTGAYFIFMTLAENDIIKVNLWESYPETLLGFLPLILLFIIPLSVIYYAVFRKRVGELYYFYTLSILLVSTMPIVLVLTFPFV